jgi:uncharacterized protein
LDASFIAVPLRPWFVNIGKRLKKHPKHFWCDTGMAAHLLGIADRLHIARHPLRGGLFENLVISEAFKAVAHWGSSAKLHLFATATHEVDLLIEAGGATLAVEIKSGQTIASDWLSGLAAAAAIPELRVQHRLVVYGGDTEQSRSETTICPWWAFPAHLARWLHGQRAATHVPDAEALLARLRAARNRG